MKKEVLRIQDMCCQASSDRGLNHISFYMFEGEVTGILGLANSGKDVLVKVLTGDRKYESGIVSVCGSRAASSDEIVKAVYKVTDRNYLISDWSVAEYLGLVENESIFGLPHKKAMLKEAAALLDQLQIAIDAEKPLKELSELEKRLVDVAKAYKSKARILLIEDEFEGFTKEDIQKFKKELERLLPGRMAALISNHSDMAASILSDRFVIFKNGSVVKKCRNDHQPGIGHLEKYLLGRNIKTKKQSLDSLDIEKNDKTDCAEIIYRTKYANPPAKRMEELTFRKGEITTILAINKKDKEAIFKVLSGYSSGACAERWLGDNKCDFDDIADFVRSRIVSVMHLGGIDELLPTMSAGENILIPSLKKLSPLEYTLAGRRLAKMLEKTKTPDSPDTSQNIKELAVNDRITLTLERWHVYNPKVLILFEPFAQCDTYGVSLVKSYIKKFSSSGTSVILIKSREEYAEEITDRFIKT